MAKKKNTGNLTSSIETNTFLKGMNKDYSASFVRKESWFHAINAYNNSADGDAGTLGNEPANLSCGDIPYPIIGAIHKEGDQWFIFCTDDVTSEIGLLDDSKCEYTTIVNDPCLNFNRKYLITGASKENYDCSWQVYWDDNLNPSRTLNVDNIPYIQIQTEGPDINGQPCVIFQDTDDLDCEKIRLAPLVSTPCILLTKNIDGGLLENGSYQAFIAYVVNGQKITDYIGISNVQSLFNHIDLTSSLNINLTNLDKRFEFFELVLLSNTKEQSVAKKIGIYSTQQGSIGIDLIDPATTSVPFEKLFARNPAYEKSESMYVVNDYLIRQGPTEQFDFNYQPLANQIEVKWQTVEYPSDYYHKGGNKTSFMRDEQYAFFIRWIYNTGERSASYHIPGRAPRVNTTIYQNGSQITNGNELSVISGTNVIDIAGEPIWQVYNTANLTSQPNQQLDDGGVIIAEGDMAYWESTEKYPATQPEIWNATSNIIWDGSTIHDLCGKNIRHHKMPTEEIHPRVKLSTEAGDKIRILGVKFNNIKRPLFNDGSIITNIVGYEILRGSREGAKSILAKGIFKNMRKYDIPEETGDVQGLYPNYPYNDLRPDSFFHKGIDFPVPLPSFVPSLPLLTGKRTEDLQIYPLSIIKAPPLDGYSQRVFTFHTPELPFRLPYLNAFETRIYGKYKGEATGYFKKSEEHPGEKLLRNIPIIFAAILGVGYAMEKFKGKKNTKNLPLRFVHHNPDFVNDTQTLSTIPGAFTFGSGSGSSTSSVLTPGRALTQPQGLQPVAPGAGALLGYSSAGALTNFIDSVLETFTDLGNIVTGGIVSEEKQKGLVGSNYAEIAALGGTEGGGMDIEYEGSDLKSLPNILRGIFSVPGFLIYTAEGANVLIDLFYNLMSHQDYALKHNSHGFYNKLESLSDSLFRTSNLHQNYIGSTFVNFGDSTTQLYKINNLDRPDTIVVGTSQDFIDPLPNEDKSRYSLGQLEAETITGQYENIHVGILDKIVQPICSLYGALKFKIDNQYGQLGGVKQTPMRGCVQYIDQDKPRYFPFNSESFFTGDVYINRYTEKTIMPIFTDFLYGQPDGFTYDYLKYVNIPYPRYWMNTERYDFSKLYTIFENVGSILSNTNDQNDYYQYLPSDLYALDVAAVAGIGNDTETVLNSILNNAKYGFFGVTKAYMYTHVNGVQDFFVESEINIAQRDWLDEISKRHYDPFAFTGLNEIFDAAHIRKGNFYLYDYSLSISRQITNLTNFSYIQALDYDPQIAETCYTFYPKRLIYSLRAQEEAKKDFWRVFLPNNYKDFKNKVSVIKPVNQTGALMFFPYASPKMFMGVDQLQSDLGTKIILGDGGLFAREPQNITNSDLANEYASCESARSVINTPMGVFFMSQAQGKIFQYTGKLVAISDQGMKWWFNKYLPSILLRQFPELEGTELDDNPVVGIGCQAVYDINDDIVYFTKKDYSVKDEFINNVSFNTFTCQFTFSNDITSFPIKLEEGLYFDNASWTISYDPKIKGWISFHDWHPEFVLPSINHFLTTKTFVTDNPKCPPTYYLNNTTGLCEKLIIETAPGFVYIDEVDANIQGGTDGCPIDIVLAVDSSSSTDFDPLNFLTAEQILNQPPPFSYGTKIEEKERLFVYKFLTNPIIVNGLNNGTIQVGVTLWSSDILPVLSYNIGGNTMLSSIDANLVDTWLTSNWWNAGTDGPWGKSQSLLTLNDKVNSDLGNRVTIPGFKQVLLMVNDLNFGGGFTGTCAGPDYCFDQSNTIGAADVYPASLCPPTANPVATGPANQFIYSIVTTASGNLPADAQHFALTCWNSNFLFQLQVSNNDVDIVVGSLITDLCSLKCDCLPGYTLVYPNVTNSPVVYDQQTGDCETNILQSTGGLGNGTPVIEEQSLECPIDLVFVVQADDSTSEFGFQNPSQKDVMINFIEQFLQNGDIQNAINSQNMQVGITMHARAGGISGCQPAWFLGPAIDINYSSPPSLTDRFNFGGSTYMASFNSATNTDALAIASGFRSWLYANWIGDIPGVGSTWGVDYGQRYAIENVIDLRGSNSQLLDRSSDPNYRAFVFHVTGVVNSWNAGAAPGNPLGFGPCWDVNNIANQNISQNQVPTSSSTDDYLYSMVSYIPWNDAGTSNVTPGGWLSPLHNSNNDSHLFQMDDIQNLNQLDYTQNVIDVVNLMKQICNNPTNTVDACDCYDYTLTIFNSAPLDQYEILWQECVSGTYHTQTVQKGQTINLDCIRENSISFIQSIVLSDYQIVEVLICDTQYDCNSGPTQEPTFTTYPAICRKIECGCPPSPIPNATLNQDGDCSGLSIYTTTGVGAIPPGLITCQYEALLQIPPSFESGSIWRHNYRCDLYANFYGVDYPWEVELIENTGQAVNTIRSFEYQLETYVYKGDLHDGCGDDRWHDLDFNFDKAIIYNSEQVSGLLTLVPHPKEDPLNMIIYPIIGAQDIQILYSKEEQKYRFNQFWDITADRAEFTTPPFPTYQYQPGITPSDSPGQNIFITELNGYIKDLNFNNLLYQKSSSQRKKFRHYFNKVILRRTLSGNRKMLLKLNNTKLNISVR